MSKWIYSAKQEMWWNLDKVEKIRLRPNHIELIYQEDGVAHVEFETPEMLQNAWNALIGRLI